MGNTTGIQRFKPRASARVQLVLAASLWFVASLVLGVRGEVWLAHSVLWLPLTALAVTIGLLKARFLLDGVARGAAERIKTRGPDKCAGGFLSWRAWLLILSMMGGGVLLRHTATPRPVLGVLYVAVCTALAVAARIYWREVLAASR